MEIDSDTLNFENDVTCPGISFPTSQGIAGHLTLRIFWCNNNTNNNNNNNNNDDMMRASHFQHGICWDDYVPLKSLGI